MVQQLIVGLIVAAAALYVAWRYLPARWRRPLGRLHPRLGAAPGCGGDSGAGAASSGGGCGSCGGCGSGNRSAGAAPQPVSLPPRRP